MSLLARLALFGLAIGFAVAAIVLCGLELVNDDHPTGPPIVIPTTYGPPPVDGVL